MITAQTHIIQLARSVAASAPLPFRWRFLVPFLVLAAVELALLLTYTQFMAAWVSRFAVPAVAFFFGEESLHYPEHILNLPSAVDWIRCAAVILVGVLVFPRATLLLHEHFRKDDTPRPPASRGTATVFVAIALYALIDVTLQRGVVLLDGVPIVTRFLPMALAAVLVARPALTIVTAHTVFGISVGGHRGPAAVRSALIAVRRYRVATAVLAIAAALLLAPLDMLLAQSSALVDAGRPGIVELVAALAILLDAPVRLVLFGSTVWLRVSRGTP